MATEAQMAREAARQRALVAAAREELRAFWRNLPLGNPEASRDLLLEFMPALVDKYGKAAGYAAAEFYDTLRADARTSRAFTALVAEADLDGVRSSTRRLAGVLFGDSPTSMLAGLDAVVDTQVKRVYRNTITRSAIADPDASGWERVLRGASCPFCQMLASRGAVYRKDTADFAAHHDCDCGAAPSWDASAPEVDARQYEASTATGAMSESEKAAHAERVRQHLDDFAA